MAPLRTCALAALLLAGCALVHERAALDGPDAAVPDAAVPDAAVPDAAVPCARSRAAIPAPRAREAGFSILLELPRASTDGERIVVTAAVISDRQGGIGSSDVLTVDASGGTPRPFFTTDLPYVLGTAPGLEEYLEGGGLHRGRVWGEIRRFRNDYDSVVFADDVAIPATDAPIRIPLADPAATFSIFEIARDGDRALRFDDHRGLVQFTVSHHAIVETTSTMLAAGVQLVLPTPRLSPSGRLAGLRSGADRTVLTIVELDTLAITTHPMGVEAKAIAFVDDAHVLVLPRGPTDPMHPELVVLSLRDDTTRVIDVGLPPESSPSFEGLDVSAHGETLVVTAPGGGLEVIRCDPALRDALTP